MHLKSILTSGIVTGISIMAVGGGLVPIIGNQMEEVLRNRLLPPLSNGAMAYFAFYSLAIGIGAMGFYALVKSRVPSKPKAILTTAFVFWFFTYFLANAALVAYGFMPLGLTVIGTAWGLLELLIGITVGSMIYKEENV
ncbi:MAG: hypothetical protein ACTHJT_14380 [Cytophaga sp.]|uniref:hypothetical protein n=1 Tax=Cytophaga sp. TaxID=29535 RepID=UPI003F7D2B8A